MFCFRGTTTCLTYLLTYLYLIYKPHEWFCWHSKSVLVSKPVNKWVTNLWRAKDLVRYQRRERDLVGIPSRFSWTVQGQWRDRSCRDRLATTASALLDRCSYKSRSCRRWPTLRSSRCTSKTALPSCCKPNFLRRTQHIFQFSHWQSRIKAICQLTGSWLLCGKILMNEWIELCVSSIR